MSERTSEERELFVLSLIAALPKLTIFAKSLDKDYAQDLVQGAVYKVLKKQGPIAKPAKYLATTLFRLYLDDKRREQPTNNFEYIDFAVTQTKSPLQNVMNAEVRGALEDVLSDFSKDWRDGLRSYFLDAPSLSQLAKAQGISYNTMSHRVTRAKEKLKRKLKSYESA